MPIKIKSISELLVKVYMFQWCQWFIKGLKTNTLRILIEFILEHVSNSLEFVHKFYNLILKLFEKYCHNIH